VAAAATIAAALSQHASPELSGSDQPAAEHGTPTAAAAVQVLHTSSSARGRSPWAQLLSALPQLTNLTTLEFAGNGGSYFLTSRPSSEADFEKGQNKLRIYEPAMLLLRFAAAAESALHTVYFTNADHHHHAPHVGSIREHTGELSGHWNDALPAVAAAMLLAKGECQVAGQQVPVSSSAADASGGGAVSASGRLEAVPGNSAAAAGAAAAAAAAGAGAGGGAEGKEEGPLEQQLGSMQVAAEHCSGSSSSANVGCAVSSNRVFSAAATQRLQALTGKLQAAQQQQQFEDSDQALERANAAAHLCLSKVEAIEALQLLLPGLQSLHFPW
jgi:hypothetical protein